MRRLLLLGLLVLLVALVGFGAGAGFSPIRASSREAVFDIPKGTYARRRAGEPVDILPDHMRLTLGVRDVLVIRNHDDVPQTFGPTIIMPGQSFTLPFERAASYQFVCTAHASGQLVIEVEPEPVSPWARIHWRMRNWWENRKQ